MTRLLLFFRQQWFLTTLAALIATGIALGLCGFRPDSPEVKPWLRFIDPRITTGCVLFLMAFSLDSGMLRASFRAPAPVLTGFAMNYGFVPLFAWLLSPWQAHVDFRTGLMIAATVPCTVAAASVMTRKARGNDAVSLLITLSTNSLCFVLTPLWLSATIAQKVELDAGQMMLQLLQAVLLPTMLGQLLRQPRRLCEFAKRHKTPIGVAAQILIEVLVLSAALHAGVKLRDMQSGNSPPAAAGPVIETAAAPAAAGAEQAQDLRNQAKPPSPAHQSYPSYPSHTSIDMQRQPTPDSPTVTAGGAVTVWLSCVAIHFGALFCGLFLARRLGFDRAACSAVAFAGSQKTLPVGLLIATDPAFFGTAHPFAVFPMLLYHTSQLFFDTAIAGWLARQDECSRNREISDGTQETGGDREQQRP